MLEFLIRTQETHDWPAIQGDRTEAVLTPREWDCVAIDGWGDYRVRCGETEISFSGEDVGWQVTFEGPMSARVAEQFIAAVAAQIAQELDQPVEWIPI